MAASQCDVSTATFNGLFVADSRMTHNECSRTPPLRTFVHNLLSISAQIDDQFASILVRRASTTGTTECPAAMPWDVQSASNTTCGE